MNALKGNVELSRKEIDRCKNFFALRRALLAYDRPMENTLGWIASKFGKNPELAKANEIALKDRLQLRRHHRAVHHSLHIKKAQIAPGKYRKDYRQRSNCPRICRRFLSSPAAHCFMVRIRSQPASDIFTSWQRHKSFGVKTFQAEDEIRRGLFRNRCASFAGQIGLTGTSGPGVA
jgi:2-oxoglutarate ferredoxin oxidoreductase subunit alpha